MLYKSKKPMAGIAFIENGTVKQATTIIARDNPSNHGDYSPANIANGYGFKDGVIKGPTAVALDNSTSYYNDTYVNGDVAFSTFTSSGFGWDENTAVTKSGNYVMYTDVTINASRFWSESYIFDGVLDGCGHTLTINCSQSGSWTSAHAFGTLLGTLSGTIKNIKIVVNFFWSTSGSNGAKQFVGGIAGRIINGTLDNVSVEVNCYSGQTYSMQTTGRPTSNELKMVGGLFGEAGDSQQSTPPTCTATFNNVTIKINSIGWQNTAGGNIFGYPDVKFGVGGCIGHIAQNCSVTMKNITLQGTGNLASSTTNGNSGGTSKSHKGGLVAYSQGNFSLENCLYSYSGSPTNNENLNNYYECSVIGAFDTNGTLSITNFYYSTGSYAKANGYLEWQDTQTALFGQEFANAMEPYLGFEGNDLWIGDITQIKIKTCGLGAHDCDGKYLDKIEFTNGDIIVAKDIAPVGIPRYRGSNLIAGSGIIAIAKIAANILQSSSNVIQDVTYGYYSHVTNEQGSSAGTFKMYYNNGSYVDYSFPVDFNGRVSVYDYLERKVINGQAFFAARDCGYNYYTTE